MDGSDVGRRNTKTNCLACLHEPAFDSGCGNQTSGTVKAKDQPIVHRREDGGVIVFLIGLYVGFRLGLVAGWWLWSHSM